MGIIVRLVPRRLRRIHQFLAWLAGRYWVPCPLCGSPFGAHEAVPGGTIPRPGTGRHGSSRLAVCPDCARELAFPAEPDATPWGQGTAITPDPEGDVPVPASAPRALREKEMVMLPAQALSAVRVQRAVSLYDATADSLRLGNGHARLALREAVQTAALFRDENWVTEAVSHLIRPDCREGIARQLRHIVRSALAAEES